MLLLSFAPVTGRTVGIGIDFAILSTIFEVRCSNFRKAAHFVIEL